MAWHSVSSAVVFVWLFVPHRSTHLSPSVSVLQEGFRGVESSVEGQLCELWEVKE